MTSLNKYEFSNLLGHDEVYPKSILIIFFQRLYGTGIFRVSAYLAVPVPIFFSYKDIRHISVSGACR
jgi:hypothetical protein